MHPPGVARLGVFGGSFDPVHWGHLAAAEAAREAFSLDRILWVPCDQPPHKRAQQLAPARDRLAMVRRAVRGHPGFEVSDLEIRRGGVSYTADTLAEIRRRVGPKTRIFLIVGIDTANTLDVWRRLPEIARQAALVVVHRPGERLDRAGIRRRIGPGLSGWALRHVVDVPGVEMASRDLRDRIRRGLSVRYRVPESVRRYAEKKRLYRS